MGSAYVGSWLVYTTTCARRELRLQTMACQRDMTTGILPPTLLLVKGL